MMDQVFTMVFNLMALSMALGVPEPDVRAILSDARTATPIMKRRIAADHPGWRLEPAIGGVDQLRDPNGAHWAVKSISTTTDFRPSAQIGVGRSTDDAGVARRWGGIAGYLLIDTSQLPRVTVYRIPIANLERWRAAGRLGANYRVRRAVLMTNLIPDIRFAP